MMLYHLDSRNTFVIHWTEIYVIITVSTMVIEEGRRVKFSFIFFYFKRNVFI